MGKRWLFLVPVLIASVAPGYPRSGSADPPAAAPPEQQIRRLVEALGDMNYFVRQKAEGDLAKVGFPAIDALTEATDSDDMEIVARAERLLRVIKGKWAQPGDPPGVVQALNEYESQDDAGRTERVAALLGLSGYQGVPAVCRVICYDRSPVLAKTAALQLVESLSTETVKPELAAEIRKCLAGYPLAGGQRLPALWVLSWLATGQDPQALAAVWSKIGNEEEAALLRHPRETSPAIVESLLQFQIAALRKAHRGSDATVAVRRLMKLHHGEPAALTKLLEWLTEQKDWPATRQVEEQYRATIAESPELLYLVAEAQACRGDRDAAEQSAAQALKLKPEINAPALMSHLQSGQGLEDRGRHEWAVREWDYVVRNAPADSQAAIYAARSLSESYHDLEQDRQAAETLATIVKAFSARSDQWKLLDGDGSEPLTLGALRARMHFFEACGWREQKDREKQYAALDAALATQAYDIEVLIECYHLAGASADYRARIRKLIEKMTCELREQIGDSGNTPGAAQPCNEFAWLVANTEGDLDEALRFSERSLALAGDNGSYCDTLARVYYARGDLDEALKRQTEAAAMLPRVHAVQVQLALLREKTAGKKQDVKQGAPSPKPE